MIATALLFALAVRGPAAEPVDPMALLREAMAPPAAAYYGKLFEVQWYGKKSRAAEVQVFYKPPSMVRREIRSRRGGPPRLTVSDGDDEWIVLPAKRRAW